MEEGDAALGVCLNDAVREPAGSREQGVEDGGHGDGEGDDCGCGSGGASEGGGVGGAVQTGELARGGAGQQRDDGYECCGEKNNSDSHDRLPEDDGVLT